jgi:hypothetical protein
MALLALFLIIFNLSGKELWAVLLPIIIMIVIAYKGFYQFWKNLEK